MTSITAISGRGVPLRGNDIDTDRIIPARFLRCVTFDGLGDHAFEDDRQQEHDAGRAHPFDDDRYTGGSVLVVNANFGCGSSREHAPQAIQRWGINAIVGVSFAEIFFGNCIALGLPCVMISSADAERLQAAIEAEPGIEVSVDVAGATVTAGDLTIKATIAEGPQKQFVDGQWDATGQLLSNADKVAAKAKEIPYLSF